MNETPPPASVLKKTAAGTGWVIGWRMATRVLGLGSTLILVRMLMPEDFGLVALAVSFAQAIEGFSWLGVEDAVIRERNPSRDVYDTGFTLNVLRCAATGLIILAGAWPAGDFFSEPRITPVLLVLALATILDGFSNIGTVDFRRDFAFGKEFQLFLLPRICGALTTVAIAVLTRSYWALVIGTVVQRVLKVAFSYRMHPYRPRLTLKEYRRLIGYSLGVWALGIAVLLRDRGDSMLIGRLRSPTDVGIYTIGHEIAALPSTELVDPLSRAAFSGFAAERNADVTPSHTYLRIIATMALLTLPAGVGISLVADPLIRLAFGPLWLGVIPIVQILAIAWTAGVFGNISSTLFRAHGLMATTVRITVLGMVVRLGMLALLLRPYGLVGGAIGVACGIAVEQGAFIAVILRHLALGPMDFLLPIWRSLAAAAVMAAVLSLTGLGWHATAQDDGLLVLALAEGVVAGAVVYTAALLALWLASGRPQGAERDVLGLLQGLVRGVSSRLLGARG